MSEWIVEFMFEKRIQSGFSRRRGACDASSRTLRAWRVACCLVLLILLGAGARNASAQIFFGPLNDNLTNAWVLTGSVGTTNGDSFGATSERGEQPPYCFAATNTVWFTWTAPSNGFVTFDTFGSFYDTVLAVYENFGFSPTNVNFNNLFIVGQNDDALSAPGGTNSTNSSVSFSAFSGITYYIQLSGYDFTQEGFYVLNWSMTNSLSFVPLSFNQIQFASPTNTVDESTPGFATIQVLYNGGASGPVTVNYATSDGTAIAGVDYFPASGTLTFALGETNKSFVIPISDNGYPNSNRTVILSLYNPTGGATLGGLTNALLTIIDNETVPFISEAGQFNFSSAFYHVTENEELTGASVWNNQGEPFSNVREVPGALITVTRTGGSKGRVMVDYSTSNKFPVTNDFFFPFLTFCSGSFGFFNYFNSLANTIAIPNYDYLPISGTLIFDDFQASTNFIMPIPFFFNGVLTGTNSINVNKLVNLVLSNPRPAPEENPDIIVPSLGPTNQATLAIVGVNQLYIAPPTGQNPPQGFFAIEKATYRANEYSPGGGRTHTIRVDVILPGGGGGGVDVTVRVFGPGLSLGYPLQAGSDYAQSFDFTGSYPETSYTDGSPDISSPSDYVAASAVLSFPNGNTSAQHFFVTINDDDIVEFNEDIEVELLTPHGKQINPAAQFANITILFDDQPAGALDREWNPDNVPSTTPPFNLSPGANDVVYTVGVQEDQKPVIGGEFTAYNAVTRNRVARINLDGSIDAGFNPGTGADGYVSSLAIYPSTTPNPANAGKIIIGGGFTSFNGVGRYGIARLNTDGSLDATFRPGNGADGPVRSVALQNDGKVVIAGEFSSINGVPRAGIARLNEDGTLDFPFDPGAGANATIWSVAVRDTARPIFVPRTATGTELEDDNVIETGANQGVVTIDYSFLGAPDNIQVFYDGNQLLNSTTSGRGNLVIPYGPGNSTVVTIIMNQGIGLPGAQWSYRANITPVIPERTIFVGGDFTTFNSQPRNGVARLRDDGSLDLTFDPRAGTDNSVYSVAVQADGKLLIGGAFTDFDFRSRNSIARLNGDGSIDEAYDPGVGADDSIFNVRLQADGKAYIGGLFTSYNGTRRIGLARLFVDGSLDTSFMDTAYNQFAGLCNPFSFQPPNYVKAIVPYTRTNITITSSQVITNNTTNTVFSTNVVLTDFVMIGGSFTNLGGNASSQITDNSFYTPVWTRQDKRTRYNVARLIGGYTPGPGNVEFTFPSYPIDESTPVNEVTLRRIDGRLGTIIADTVASDRLATAGVDYLASPGTNTWPEFAYGAPRSVGFVGPVYWPISILEDFLVEGNETVDLNLIKPEASITLGGEYIPLGGARGHSYAPMVIVDNDVNHGTLFFGSRTYATNETAGFIILNVLRTNGSSGSVSVKYYTVNGTALAGTNYSSSQATLTFDSGVTNRTIQIPIIHNLNVDFDKSFTVVLTNATGGATLPGGLPTSMDSATATIIDSDFRPGRLNFSSATYSTNEDSQFATITVTRSGGNVGAITVNVAATNGTARSGVNFTARTNILTWNAGQTTPQTFTVPIFRDNQVQGPLTVNLRLFNASTNGAIGAIDTAVLILQDVDSYGRFSFTTPNYSADENGAVAFIPVIRTGGTNGTVRVDYRVDDGSAINGVNYLGANGTLVFGPTEISKAFALVMIDDDIAQGPQTVLLGLTNPVAVAGTNLVSLGTNGLGVLNTATLTIIDDETISGPAGSLDASFSLALGANAPIYALALEPSGNVIVAGDFTTLNNITRQRLGRLHADGSFDAAFNAGAGPNRPVRAMALQNDGKIVIGGLFTTVSATNRSHVARLNNDGSLDGFFNPGAGADNPIYAVALTPDNKVVIGGSFTTFNGVSRPNIAMLNTNGSLNTAFNPGLGANDIVYAVAVQPDGKVLLGGDFTTVNNTNRNHIARLNADGSVDATFDPGTGAADGSVRAIVVQPDGGILIGGSFTSVNGTNRNYLARLNANGSLDATFMDSVAGGDGTVYALALQADGRIIVVGDFTSFNSVFRGRITRLRQDGTTDPTINFGSGADSFIAAVLIQPDRKIVIGGGFTTVEDQPHRSVARLHGGSIAGAGNLEFDQPLYTVSESGANAVIVVRRNGGTTGSASIDYATEDITATAGLDYSNTVGTLTFPEGEVRGVFTIPIIDDTLVEDPEDVALTLSNPTGGASLGPQPFSILTILSDDSVVQFVTSTFSVNENVLASNAVITVVRTGSTNTTVSVDYGTADGTARAGLDYFAVSGSLIFAPGETTKTFLVPIRNDALVEGNETVILSLANVSGGAVLTLSTATLTIVDDDLAPGQFVFSSPVYTVNEYDTNITITVLRTNGSSQIVGVHYATVDGTARAGQDYTPSSGTLTFSDGETVKTFNVPITPDYVAETNETVFVTLTSPSGGATLGALNTATVTIIDNNLVNGNLNFSATNYTVSESNATATITVTRTLGSQGSVSVRFAASNGTAFAGTDYVATNGTLFWVNGETTSRTFTVPVINDNIVEGTKIANLTLSNPTGGATLGPRPAATLTILDDDTGAGFLGFSSATYSVAEDATNATITVVRSFGNTGTVSIVYYTSDGTALNGVNYLARSNVLTFAASETSKTFTVPVIDVPTIDVNKTVLLSLANPIGGSTNGQIISAVLTILEKSPPAGSIDTTFNNTGANGAVASIVLQTNNNKLFAGGDFTLFSGLTRNHLVRMLPSGAVDNTFDPGTNLNNAVQAITVQTNGEVVLGGSFTSFGGRSFNYLGRLQADGTPGTNFLAGLSGVDNFVYALALQSDAKLMIGGLFTTINGVSRNFIARLDSTGQVDPTFVASPGPDAGVRAIAIQTDGKIIIAGDFLLVNGLSRGRVARLNPNGAVDQTFQDPMVDNTVSAVVIQPDGRIVIGGLFTNVNSTAAGRVARLNTDGSLDTTFNSPTPEMPTPGANGFISAVALQADGKVLIGGGFTSYNGLTRNRLARLNADGTIDPTINFGSGANNFVSTIVVQTDRKIVIGGGFTDFNGTPRSFIARLNGGENAGSGAFVFSAPNYSVLENGTNVTITVLRQIGTLNSVSVDYTASDGTATNGIHYAVNNGTLFFGEGETIKTFTIAIFDDSITNVDRTFNVALRNPAGGATLGTPNTAVVRIINNDCVLGFAINAYSVSENAGSAVITVQRTASSLGTVSVDYSTRDGTAAAGSDYVAASGTLVFTNGQVLQSFTVPILDDILVEGNETVTLVLSNATGTAVLGLAASTLTIVDNDFSPGVIYFSATSYSATENGSNAVVTLLRTNGSLGVVSVQYITSGGTATPNVDYVAQSGTLLFGQGQTNLNLIIPIIDDSLIEGDENFNLTISNPGGGATIAGPTNVIIIIHDDEFRAGTVDAGFDPGAGANNFVRSLAAQSDGRIVIGGAFTSFNNTNRQYIARLNTNGMLDLSFNPGSGASALVSSVAELPDGRVMLGGGFTNVNSVAFNRVARLNTNGAPDLNFNQGPSFDAAVNVLAAYPNGRVVVGGGFTLPAHSLIQLRLDGTVDTSFNLGAGANGPVHAVALQTNGQVLIGGAFTAFNEAAVSRIVRLNSNGSLDSSFNAIAITNGTVYCMALQSDGKVILGGDFFITGKSNRVGLVRLNSDGSVDGGFDPGAGANGAVFAMAFQSQGKLIIAGSFTTVNNTNRDRLARLNSNGSLDTVFSPGTGANNTIFALAVLPDDNIIIGGDFTVVDSVPRNRVAKIQANDAALRVSQVAFVSGHPSLTIVSRAGTSYILQASSNLTTWTDVSTNIASGPALIVTDPNSGSFNHRFYRVRQGP